MGGGGSGDASERRPLRDQRDQRERREPRDVQVEPMRNRHLHPDQERSGQGCERAQVQAPGPHGDEYGEQHDRDAEPDLHRAKPRVLAPDRERRRTIQLVAQCARPERVQSVVAVQHQHPAGQDHCDRDTGDVRAEPAARGGRTRERMSRPQCQQERRAELAHDGQADREPPGHRSVGQHKPPDQARRNQGVVGVALEGICGERKCRPREPQTRPQAPTAEPPAQHDHAEQRNQVKQHGGPVRGRQIVPFADPRQRQLKRNICQVRPRPVGVALAAVAGERAVRRLSMRDAVGADHARVPDIDDIAVECVEAQPQADGNEH